MFSRFVQKKYDKDLLFIFKAVLIAGVIMVGLQLLRPYVVPPDPRQGEIDAFVDRIQLVKPGNAASMITSASGKPVMLVIYTSWCGTCRRVLPTIADLIRENRLNHVEYRFVSLDRSIPAISTYLVHNGYPDVFTPYLATGEGAQVLRQLVQQAGGAFDGRIPYIAFFTPGGKLAAHFMGGADRERLLAMAERVKH